VAFMARPKKYLEQFKKRLPNTVRISKYNHTRIHSLKIIIHKQNDNEILTLALEALEKQITVNNDVY
jgi:hypothetical protein